MTLYDVIGSPEITTEVVVVERHRGTGADTEDIRSVVPVVVRRHGVGRHPCFLGRLYLNVAVLVDTGPCRDQLTDDHVLLESDQRVAATIDSRVGASPRHVLDCRSGQPR